MGKLRFVPALSGSAKVCAVLLAGTALATPGLAFAETAADNTTATASGAQSGTPSKTTDDKATPNGEIDENGVIIVKGSLGALPTVDNGTVFGFDKTIAETPRSVSSVSSEQMERFGITDIYDLVAQTPGAFTNSFFGVGGALDIRGTPGEVYYRGMRRLDNPGNYPTPIAASARIDIVRGPASPIYGPSKTGGYMNFVPKSARVAGGKYLDHAEGQITMTGGSWDKKDLQAEVRGPGKIGAQEFGYSLYAEIEDSGSYYRNMSTRNGILQGSFDTDLAPGLKLEFGGMYQSYRGQQNGGWNRVTQDLVDNGTYITGTAQSLDANGDGKYSAGEIKSQIPAGTLAVFGAFACGGGTGPTGFTDACLQANYPYLALQNTGTTQLSRRDVLTGKDDYLNNDSTLFYADLTYETDGGLQIQNKAFYDSYLNHNANSYGFSQMHDSWVFEDKIIVSKTYDTTAGKFAFQLSPSVRYTHFRHADDYTYEYFNRVDLSQGYTPASARLLSIDCDFSQPGAASDCGWTNDVEGYYTDMAMAGLADLDFAFGLDITAGARYDWIKAYSTYLPQYMEFAPDVVSARDGKGAWSWNISATYKLPFGLMPYVTLARQSTVVAGQGAELYAENLQAGTWTAASKLKEAGVKGQFLDNRLYLAVSFYEQKRTDFNNQSITVNQAVKTRGLEAEGRWAVDDHLLLSAGYTRTKVYNLTALNNGSLFGFFGAADTVNLLDPSLGFGGQLEGLVPITSKSLSRRAGIPTNLYSATATYAFDNGLALSASAVKVDSVYTSQSQAVRIPGYTKIDASVSYQTGPWTARVVVKNLTDKKYFRANFTELFGATIVLPELPRSVQASLTYKF